jgi:uncharacterized membrane protein
MLGKRSQGRLESPFAFILIDKVEVSGNEILVGWQESYPKLRLSNGIFRRGLSEKYVVDRLALTIL